MSLTRAAYGVVGDYVYGPAAPFLNKLASHAGNTTTVYPIGGTYVERVDSVSFTIVAVGGATTRIGVVSFLDEGGVAVGAAAAPFGVTAGSTSRISLGVGANNGGAANGPAIVGSLPPLYLPAGYSVVLSISGGAAADTLGTPRILVARFSTDPEVFSPGQG